MRRRGSVHRHRERSEWIRRTGGLPRPQPAASASTPTQITVQVQAMDSQSFLDHSNDIAQAVRQAMLESTTLNDVIREV